MAEDNRSNMTIYQDDSKLKEALVHIEKLMKYSNLLEEEEFYDNDILVEGCAYNMIRVYEILKHSSKWLALKLVQESIIMKAPLDWAPTIHNDDGSLDKKVIWESINTDYPNLYHTIELIRKEYKVPNLMVNNEGY